VAAALAVCYVRCGPCRFAVLGGGGGRGGGGVVGGGGGVWVWWGGGGGVPCGSKHIIIFSAALSDNVGAVTHNE